MKDRELKSPYFEEICLLVDINMNITLKMPFFTMNNIEIDFVGHHIYYRMYTITELPLTTRQVKLIKKKEFTIIVFDLQNKAFIVYVASISKD